MWTRGNPASPVGLLRSCFDSALDDATPLEGVFSDVRAALRFSGARDIAHRVGKVVGLRNGCIAHGSDAGENPENGARN